MPPQAGGGGGKKVRSSGGEGKRARSSAAGTAATTAGNAARATAAAAAAGPSSHPTGRKAAGAAGGVGQGRRGPFVYRGEFKRDVEGLMYAFGDDQHPDPSAVAILEDMTVSFLVDLCRRARPAPNQLAISANAAYVQTLASNVAQQNLIEHEQQLVDDAADRAAAGTSASARAKVQRRAAAAAAAKHQLRETEMPVRTAVHPFVGRSRMTVEDVKFACRKDPKMASRIDELIYLDKEITHAKRVFEVPADDAINQETAAGNDIARGGSGGGSTGTSAAVPSKPAAIETRSADT